MRILHGKISYHTTAGIVEPSSCHHLAAAGRSEVCLRGHLQPKGLWLSLRAIYDCCWLRRCNGTKDLRAFFVFSELPIHRPAESKLPFLHQSVSAGQPTRLFCQLSIRCCIYFRILLLGLHYRSYPKCPSVWRYLAQPNSTPWRSSKEHLV